MKVAFVQTKPVFGDVEGNVRRALKLAQKTGGDLIVLPELFSTGYQFKNRRETFRLSEAARGSYTIGQARSFCEKTGAFLVGGFAEKAGKKVYNSAFLAGPDGLISVYRKIHLFASEKDVFDGGDSPFSVHDIGVAKVGMMICFDWTFPESMRTLALLGAEVIAHPSNLVMPWCQRTMPGQCLQNSVFAVTANRVGSENRTKAGKLTFTGQSQITGPRFEILAQGDEKRIDTDLVEIDPKRAADKWFNPKNHRFDDRRPDLYSLSKTK